MRTPTSGGRRPGSRDIRGCEGGWFGAALANRLQELQLVDATIGIPHLDPNGAGGDSPIPSGSLNALREALPKARLVDATSLMDEQRSVKSEEEIAVLERAVAIAKTGIFMLGYQARAGMAQTEAFGVLQAAILEAGGEPGSRVLWDCSPSPGRAAFQALPAPMQRGDVIQNELEVKLAGYGVQEIHPICVGKPPQQVYDAFELCLKIVGEALPLLAPGAPLREVVNVVERSAEGTAFQATLVAHGCGLAPEPPADDWTVWREGQVLTFGPTLQASDGTRISFRTTVAVTAEGGRRLGKRPLELMLTSRSFMSAYVDLRRPQPTAPWLS